MAGFSPRLIRLPVKKGKEKIVKSWLKELIQNPKQNLESMHIEEIESEAVFTSTHEEQLYLTWVVLKSVPEKMKISDTPIDRKHHRVLMDCIDFESPLEEAELQYGLNLAGVPLGNN